jgi:glycosyltransferase involved in cell wall biosynthesis
MKILLLAPHPFFQERGTPIDVMLVLRVLTRRPGTRVDAVVYSEGSDIDLPNLRLFRIRPTRFTRGIRPGFSWKKVLCDLQMFFKARALTRREGYDLVHAGEESALIALVLKVRYGVPYVYDLDSSIAQQVVEARPSLRWLAPILSRVEATAIQRSLATFPVCNALAELCEAAGSRKTVTLHDISQLEDPDAPPSGWIRRLLGLAPDDVIVLYSGNLEPYQGIDLLLESFSLAAAADPHLHLIVVGGMEEDVERYRRKAERLGIAGRAHLLGPRPVDELGDSLAEADILVCPRIRGRNTPMKVFPYLHSGKPLLATDLYTHTQVLTGAEALLAAPEPTAFARGLLRLAQDPALRAEIGRNGRALVERNHTFEAHARRLNEAYDWLEEGRAGSQSRRNLKSV